MLRPTINGAISDFTKGIKKLEAVIAASGKTITSAESMISNMQATRAEAMIEQERAERVKARIEEIIA